MLARCAASAAAGGSAAEVADEVADLFLAVERCPGDAGGVCDCGVVHGLPLASQLVDGVVRGRECCLVAPGVGTPLCAHLPARCARSARVLADAKVRRPGIPAGALAAAMCPRPYRAELLDEYDRARVVTGGDEVADPAEVERAGVLAGLAADDAPVDAVQARRPDRAEQRLGADEPDGGGRGGQRGDAEAGPLLVLGRDSDPGVRRRQERLVRPCRLKRPGSIWAISAATRICQEPSFSSDRIRACRLVSSWKVWWRASAMTAKTWAMDSSGTSPWNRSLIDFTKAHAGLRHAAAGPGRRAAVQAKRPGAGVTVHPIARACASDGGARSVSLVSATRTRPARPRRRLG